MGLPVPDIPDHLQQLPEIVNSVPTGPGWHLVSAGALLTSIFGWLPGIIAILPALYYLILIWESRTVQGWVQRVKSRHQKAKPPEPPAAA